MSRLSLLALGIVVFLPATLPADGCILRKFGEYVQETEQYAYIDWRNGQQRLYVATRAETSTEGTLWLLPIPANPEEVRVEPVTYFPQVDVFTPVFPLAHTQLDSMYRMSLAMDSGVCLCFPFVGPRGFKSSAGGVQVHQHIEKLGMVVQVLTARTTSDLDRYLEEKQLGIRGKDITALESYLGKDFSLICAWINDPVEAKEARSLEIDFPTPHVFFPLKPTQVYQNEIKTSIFVKGWFQPKAGTEFEGLSCRHGKGNVKEWYTTTHLTRIDLPKDPSLWMEDLFLEEGAPPQVHVAHHLYQIWAGAHVLAGLLLGLVLPWVVIPRDCRAGRDWMMGGISGLLLSLTILPAALSIFAWVRAGNWRQGRLNFKHFWAGILALACGHMLVMGTLYIGLDTWFAYYD